MKMQAVTTLNRATNCGLGEEHRHSGWQSGGGEKTLNGKRQAAKEPREGHTSGI